MFAGNFQPAGWQFCEGQLLPISENETLFQLIGTTYGGDGQSTFALPDLRGRLPMHQGPGAILAQTGGAEEVTITTATLPLHSHAFLAAQTDGDQIVATGNLTANSPNVTIYINEAPNNSFNAAAIKPTGGSQPHTNFQPYLCVDFIISLFGIFPSPT